MNETEMDTIMRAVDEQNEKYYAMLNSWARACEQVFTRYYIVCADLGLVEPYYDEASLCSNTDEEWEVFQ
jgi:hypothetical protein